MTVTCRRRRFACDEDDDAKASGSGACAAGQQPGDVVMANGVKVNIPELQKRALGAGSTQPGK